jgi:hypothetical protein
MLPRTRKEGLLVHEVGQEIVIYDVQRHQAHSLNPMAAAIWRCCDSCTSVSEIVTRVKEEVSPEASEPMIWTALEWFTKAHLLQEPFKAPDNATSRREFTSKAAMAAGATVLLPLITSIAAPTPVEATSCSVSTPIACDG